MESFTSASQEINKDAEREEKKGDDVGKEAVIATSQREKEETRGEIATPPSM